MSRRSESRWLGSSTLALRMSRSNLSFGPIAASTGSGSAAHAAVAALAFRNRRRSAARIVTSFAHPEAGQRSLARKLVAAQRRPSAGREIGFKDRSARSSFRRG
jgi:hypothetical protein